MREWHGLRRAKPCAAGPGRGPSQLPFMTSPPGSPVPCPTQGQRRGWLQGPHVPRASLGLGLGGGQWDSVQLQPSAALRTRVRGGRCPVTEAPALQGPGRILEGGAAGQREEGAELRGVARGWGSRAWTCAAQAAPAPPRWSHPGATWKPPCLWAISSRVLDHLGPVPPEPPQSLLLCRDTCCTLSLPTRSPGAQSTAKAPAQGI